MSERRLKRRDTILGIVRERGMVTVDALAEMLGVSMQTIRRDIDILCEDDALHRRHGRIELAHQSQNTPFDLRAATNPSGKHRIGEAAARLIPDGATIFISIGSTTLSTARALRSRRNLTVITNNLSAAMALSDEMSNRIILPGGELRLPDRDILGSDVVDFFNRYRAEYAIFGAAGVAEDGSLLEFHTVEVRARERIRENARSSILVLDSMKFGRLAPAAGENIREVDHLVLDRMPGDEFAGIVEDMGARLILAEGRAA
ncbi:DeoR family transcriptional regulator [Pelagivirga sediminicola]|uniref:DeoR family transcriptional regulator n=1 Tax=Pelagivirga sediminicola TaxID=2170575 RepID=A0A2T7GAB8_9RHOB|nr:DeoR/GlpR family DNA-binding transcription regulator [Pelagivirga sediminicola]PVA11370.1 DeoR family transcriptional regulator [Pelagivirga sediminicola]